VYGQPESPVVPQQRLPLESITSVAGALAMGAVALVAFRERGAKKREEVGE